MLLRMLVPTMLATLFLAACNDAVQEPVTSTLITNAMIFDGSGGAAYRGAVRINFATQRIVALGDVEPLPGETVYRRRRTRSRTRFHRYAQSP